ncbi:hypothetical protein Hoch_0366 [Haliangium ochraceum DSM 14365]|uniref:Uncharacterized protein n=2 Tax=Haliangium ochraceum TaxID=80816 RepID=D0LIX8_HALO1|nr:hypothetical protein Hoch_0366 [Haliangium ochraceum DSM 14365]
MKRLSLWWIVFLSAVVLGMLGSWWIFFPPFVEHTFTVESFDLDFVQRVEREDAPCCAIRTLSSPARVAERDDWGVSLYIHTDEGRRGMFDGREPGFEGLVSPVTRAGWMWERAAGGAREDVSARLLARESCMEEEMFEPRPRSLQCLVRDAASGEYSLYTEEAEGAPSMEPVDLETDPATRYVYAASVVGDVDTLAARLNDNTEGGVSVTYLVYRFWPDAELAAAVESGDQLRLEMEFADGSTVTGTLAVP